MGEASIDGQVEGCACMRRRAGREMGNAGLEQRVLSTAFLPLASWDKRRDSSLYCELHTAAGRSTLTFYG